MKTHTLVGCVSSGFHSVGILYNLFYFYFWPQDVCSHLAIANNIHGNRLDETPAFNPP